MVNANFHYGDLGAVVQGAETAGLSAELPPLLRLAVAYAPGPARPAWTALALFDHRLSRAVAGASSPLIGQLKLAWWRDRMRESASRWPEGEPLLAALAPFDSERAALEALVDAWEGLIDEHEEADALERLGNARAGAVAALARVLDCPADRSAIATLARRWTMPDAARSESAHVPRALRPLLILANAPPSGAGLAAMLRIVRLGMFGR